MLNTTVNRRLFLASLGASLGAIALGGISGAQEEAYVDSGYREPLPDIPIGGLIRPPGALDEKLFRAKCTGCGVCANVCHALKYDSIAASGRFRDFGTPHIKDMRDFPCTLCMECPRHCPTGALRNLPKEEVTMGMALIDMGLCFGWNGDVCLSCSKVCPMGAQVFEFYNGAWGNQPCINDKCVGCGLCVKYCPLGGSAIKVVTRSKYAEAGPAYREEFDKILNMPQEERYNLIYGTNLPEILNRGRLVEREYR